MISKAHTTCRASFPFVPDKVPRKLACNGPGSAYQLTNSASLDWYKQMTAKQRLRLELTHPSRLTYCRTTAIILSEEPLVHTVWGITSLTPLEAACNEYTHNRWHKDQKDQKRWHHNIENICTHKISLPGTILISTSRFKYCILYTCLTYGWPPLGKLMQFEPTLIFDMRHSSITSESLTPLTNYTAFLNEGKTTTTGDEYYRAQSGSFFSSTYCYTIKKSLSRWEMLPNQAVVGL